SFPVPRRTPQTRPHRPPHGTVDQTSAPRAPAESRLSWPGLPRRAGGGCGSPPRSCHHRRRCCAPAPAPGYPLRSRPRPAPRNALAARRPRAAATPAFCSFPDRRRHAGTAASCARLPLYSAPPRPAMRLAHPPAPWPGAAPQHPLHRPPVPCSDARPSRLFIRSLVVGVDDLVAGLRGSGRTRRAIGALSSAGAGLCVHRLGQLEAGLLQLVGRAADPGHVLAAQRVLQILQLGLDLLPLVSGNLVAHFAQHPLGLVGQRIPPVPSFGHLTAALVLLSVAF